MGNPISPAPRHPLWKSISDENWRSWSWQLQNKISSVAELEVIAESDPAFKIDLADVKQTQRDFNFSVTPYYFSLMNLGDPDCPIRLQGLPSSKENISLPHEYLDFPQEDRMMPVPGLTHRYPDRAMLYTTHHCAMYCRFCTRKRKVSNPSSALQSKQILDAVQFIETHPEIREVILSGGDIFSFSDKQLDDLLAKVRAIPHVEIVRLGTRNLVTLPFRVTPSLVATLKKYSPIYIHTHFNHPRECTADAFQACRMLRDAGCVVNNHTVILKGVNDRSACIEELNERLITMGVQPYYLYHCDLTVGSSHFRTRIQNDVALMRELHQGTDWVREVGIPHYMIDTPGGGKIELL